LLSPPYASTAVETQYVLYRDGTNKTPLAVVVKEDGWHSMCVIRWPDGQLSDDSPTEARSDRGRP
jgi:hypothetical protein